MGAGLPSRPISPSGTNPATQPWHAKISRDLNQCPHAPQNHACGSLLAMKCLVAICRGNTADHRQNTSVDPSHGLRIHTAGDRPTACLLAATVMPCKLSLGHMKLLTLSQSLHSTLAYRSSVKQPVPKHLITVVALV